MSALDGWIDVCRAGTWRDMAGRDVALDADRLDRIVAAHASADPTPVVVGHPQADAPAYAWVETLRRVGDRLQAKLRDIAPSFREAVEAGLYSGRSIALEGDRLRHVGFLGGRAPAVPGLAPTRFASAPETVLAFAEEMGGTDDDTDDGVSGSEANNPHLSQTLSPPEERRGDEDGGAASARRPRDAEEDESRAAQRPGRRDCAARREARKPSERSERPAPEGFEESPSARRLRDKDKDTDALLAEREASLEVREAALAAREAQAVADERRRTAEAALTPHVEAGRVLPAEQAALAALLAHLAPDGDADSEGAEGADAAGRTIAFADPDGGAVRQEPAAILERFIADLPRRVEYRTLAGGPVPAGTWEALETSGEDSQRIAAEARALMAEEAERGVALTPAEAVDRARARRGLDT